jgi:biotin transport system substrate-specific component
MSTLAQAIRSWALSPVVEDKRARRVIALVAFVLLTALGAQVAVKLPWTAVPITLQPLLVILAGVVLGPRLGATAIASYVALGAAGMPIFSNGAGGFPWLLGPTGGYLLAMPLAAFVAGVVAGRKGGRLRMLAGLTLGVATIYLGGVAQLMALTGQGLAEVAVIGIFPFLTGDVTKILLAFFVARSLRATSVDSL